MDENITNLSWQPGVGEECCLESKYDQFVTINGKGKALIKIRIDEKLKISYYDLYYEMNKRPRSNTPEPESEGNDEFNHGYQHFNITIIENNVPQENGLLRAALQSTLQIDDMGEIKINSGWEFSRIQCPEDDAAAAGGGGGAAGGGGEGILGGRKRRRRKSKRRKSRKKKSKRYSRKSKRNSRKSKRY